MKKFELTSEFNLNFFGRKFFRIKALVNIERYGVKAGDLGGWVEKEDNLSQSGNAWVSGDAVVSGDAWVSGDAVVSGNAKVSGDAVVYGNAKVSGDAVVSGDAKVSGNAKVSGDAVVYGNAEVSGDAVVYGNAEVSGNAKVSGDAVVYGNAEVSGGAKVSGDAVVYGNAEVSGDAWVSGDADYAVIKGFGTVYRPTTFFRCHDGEARVTCGCFYGTIDEFREQVKRTRKGKVADEYLKIADLMEYHFKEEDSGENV